MQKFFKAITKELHLEKFFKAITKELHSLFLHLGPDVPFHLFISVI